MEELIALAVPLTVTFLLAGLVKGVTGMGLPTVAMGLLGSIMSPSAAAALLIIPSLITNIWQMLAGPSLPILLRRFGPVMLAIVIGTMAATRLMVNVDPVLSRVALGVTLIAYAGYALFSPKFSLSSEKERWLSPLVGLITGAVTGITGIYTIPAVPFLQALNLDRDALVQVLGLSFTVSTLSLAAGLILNGAYTQSQAGLSMAAVLPSIVGMWLGQQIRARISQKTFRQCFHFLLLVLGCEMTIRSFI